MQWPFPALLAGAAYFLIGRLFPQPADHLREWRLAAWIASGVVFALHIAWEQRLRRPPRATASLAALGVALGALALAVAGMLHSASASADAGTKWLVALVAWPALTAIPAFVLGLAAATVLVRLRPRAEPG